MLTIIIMNEMKHLSLSLALVVIMSAFSTVLKADVETLEVTPRSIASSSQGPLRVPPHLTYVLEVRYDDDNKCMLLSKAPSGTTCTYSVFAEDGNATISGVTVFNQDRESVIDVDMLSSGICTFELLIGAYAYTGTFIK